MTLPTDFVLVQFLKRQLWAEKLLFPRNPTEKGPKPAEMTAVLPSKVAQTHTSALPNCLSQLESKNRQKKSACANRLKFSSFFEIKTQKHFCSRFDPDGEGLNTQDSVRKAVLKLGNF